MNLLKKELVIVGNYVNKTEGHGKDGGSNRGVTPGFIDAVTGGGSLKT